MELENDIFDYLQGNLNEAQKSDFEQRLETDQEFFQEFQIVKQMHSHLLERKDREEYTAEIEKLGEKYFRPDEKAASKIPFGKILILTLIILTAFAAFWYFTKSEEVNLYDTHSDHFALHLVLKSEENTLAVNAENSFNGEDFERAIIDLKKYLEDNTIDTKAKLALGISYLETGKETEAIEIFDNIRNGGSTLEDYGTWYTALYYVKKLDFVNAKDVLKTIPKKDAQLYSKAQQLLLDINNRENKKTD